MHLTAGEEVDGLALYRFDGCDGAKRKVRVMLMLASALAAQLGDAK